MDGASGRLPVAWDDTRLVSGGIDDHVILARRKGADWYLGGIHAVEAPAEYDDVLDFLEPGVPYEMVAIEQGEDPTSFTQTARTADGGDPLSITLLVNGGFVARLTPR